MGNPILTSLQSLFSVSDEQAMWRVKMEDDPQAFTQLVNRWEKPIQALCARMTGDLARGEDLAQETFARVFAYRKNYTPSSKFSTYLWRVALNLCHDELRRVSRRKESALFQDDGEHEGVRLVADEPEPDAQLLLSERAEAVRKSLLELSEPYRAVVVLRHFEGLKFREIADVLDIPEGTVKSRMAEALGQLNRILSRSLNEKETTPCKPQTKQEILTI